jgi:hypothetical protein
MNREPLKAEALGRYVYFDDAEIAHCSDDVAADLIAYALNRARITEGGIGAICAQLRKEQSA